MRVVLVTHDPEVGAACDRIVRMRDGLVDCDDLPRVTPSTRARSEPIMGVKADVSLRVTAP